VGLAGLAHAPFDPADGKSDKLSNLDVPVSGLYLLAAPSTPEEARAEVIDRAEQGRRATGAMSIFSPGLEGGVFVGVALCHCFGLFQSRRFAHALAGHHDSTAGSGPTGQDRIVFPDGARGRIVASKHRPLDPIFTVVTVCTPFARAFSRLFRTDPLQHLHGLPPLVIGSVSRN